MKKINNNEILKEQENLNSSLADLFKENGIHKFRLTSLGNSIASGFSMVRTTMPLLMRNNSLKEFMNQNDIDLDIYHFARAQNNSDEHVFEWLTTNIKLSEIHKFNRSDYIGKETSMPRPKIMPKQSLNLSDLDKIFPTRLEFDEDIGLKDAIFENRFDMANIVVYNGCTGSFLDNVTRNGKLSEKLTYGVNRDISSLEATLKFIQNSNRKNGTNTQVYICGAPNFLGLRISEIINVKLKKVAKKYANTVYVEPVKSKFIYKPVEFIDDGDLTELQRKFKDYIRYFDIHYDEEEYLKLNNNIVAIIYENYLSTQFMIDVDRYCYDMSSKVELDMKYSCDIKDEMVENVYDYIEEELLRIEGKVDRLELCNRLKKYLLSRAPYDFHYIGKDNVKLMIKCAREGN